MFLRITTSCCPRLSGLPSSSTAFTGTTGGSKDRMLHRVQIPPFSTNQPVIREIGAEGWMDWSATRRAAALDIPPIRSHRRTCKATKINPGS